MAETILQVYLDNSIIQTTETENKTKLVRAVTEVYKRLEKKNERIASFTLVALDPQTNESDPVFIEVEKIITDKWSTFKNNVFGTKDKPINYIRVVILEALSKLAVQEKNAAIIWHTARNLFSHLNINKKEKEILTDFLQSIGQNVEVSARKKWGVQEPSIIESFDKIEIGTSTNSSVKVNEARLKKSLQDASQHTAWTDYGDGGTNPSPLNNQHWAEYFSPNAAKGIANVVDKAFDQQNQNISTIAKSIESELNSYFSNLQPFFEQISTVMIQGVVANNKRTELLWWKEALYSRGLRKSYRELSSLESAIAMAVDLNELVDPICPVSVNFLLKETLKGISKEDIDIEYSLEELLKPISEIGGGVKQLLNPINKEYNGVKSLSGSLANHLLGTNSTALLKDTGISTKSKVSLANLSIWLFNDLQAAKVVSYK